MAVNMGSLTFRMAADVTQLRQDMTEARGIVGDAAAHIGKALSTLKAVIGTIGVGWTLRELGKAFMGLVNDIDKLNERAQGLGILPEMLSDMRLAAKHAGVGFEELNTGLDYLNRRIAAATGGSKEAIAIFNALGVSYKNAAGEARDVREVIGDISDQFKAHGDSAEKAGLARDALGRGSHRMVAYLNQGSDALEENSGLTRELAEETEKLNIEFDKWEATTLRWRHATVSNVIPFLNNMVDVLSRVDWKRFFRDFHDGVIVQEREIRAAINAAKELRDGGMGPGDNPTSFTGSAAPPPFKPRDRSRSRSTRDPKIVMPFVDPAHIAGAQNYASAMQSYAASELRAAEAGLTHLQIEERRLENNYYGIVGPQIAQFVKAKAALADVEEKEVAMQELLKRIRDDEISDNKRLLADFDRMSGKTAELTKIRQAEALDKLLREEPDRYTRQQQEQLADAIGGVNREIKESKTLAQELGLTFTSAFEDAVISGAKLRDVLHGIFDDVLRMMIRRNFTEPMLEFVNSIGKGGGSTTSGGSGFLGGIFNFLANDAGGFSDFLFSVFGGAANGGRISGPKMVGERGVELFVPDSPGRIIPNHALGGITINQSYQIDSRSDRASILGAMEHTRRQTIASIIDMQRRNVPVLRN